MSPARRRYWASLAVEHQRLSARRYALARSYRDEAARVRAAGDEDYAVFVGRNQVHAELRAAVDAEHARLYLFHLIDEARP